MSRRIDKPDTDADRELREYLEARDSFTVIAGAGSGKTTTLIKALDHIGRTHGDQLRRHGRQVACITYTEVAVGEIHRDVENDPLFHVSTIHSFLWEIARGFQTEIQAWVKDMVDEKITDLQAHNAKPRTRETTIVKNEAEITRLQQTLGKTLLRIKRYSYEADRDLRRGKLGHSDIIKMVPQMMMDHPLLRRIVAERYPYVFVDESQDTFSNFVEALKKVDEDHGERFCLGFFGDPMQKIYGPGVGAIPREQHWKKIDKPENFRSPQAVLQVINRIRQFDDPLKQKGGRKENNKPVEGSATLFILPADERRDERIQQVQAWLAKHLNDPLWKEEIIPNSDPWEPSKEEYGAEPTIKTLVVVHEMVAKRLGFESLFYAMQKADSYKKGFNDGTLWMVTPFLHIILPLVAAERRGDVLGIIEILRTPIGVGEKRRRPCPRLEPDLLKGADDPRGVLVSVADDVSKLAAMMTNGDHKTTVQDILRFVHDEQLLTLNDRLVAILEERLTDSSLRTDTIPSDEETDDHDDAADDGKDEQNLAKKRASIEAYLKIPAHELWSYGTYQEGQSPFSTQHGVKGAEFDRVLVVLDDEEGTHPHYSFEKMFELIELSDADKRNREKGKESVIERTRRLFYVCCSRAEKDLAVVLFTKNVDTALNELTKSGIFNEEAIVLL